MKASLVVLALAVVQQVLGWRAEIAPLEPEVVAVDEELAPFAGEGGGDLGVPVGVAASASAPSGGDSG